MSLTLEAALAAATLFLGMMVLFELGRRFGARRTLRDPNAKVDGGPAEAAVFAILGLLLAFTFSGAASRFEARRHLITQETNAIGTAYLRIDLLSVDDQAPLRALFVQYLDNRLATYSAPNDAKATQAKLQDAQVLQGKIWSMAVVASQKEPAGHAARLLLPAINDMIDITTVRMAATENHPPSIIFLLLAGLSLVTALMVGYVGCTSSSANRLPIILFAATMAVTLYVILDLEYPRLGMIRVDAADHSLRDLRDSMR